MKMLKTQAENESGRIKPVTKLRLVSNLVVKNRNVHSIFPLYREVEGKENPRDPLSTVADQ